MINRPFINPDEKIKTIANGILEQCQNNGLSFREVEYLICYLDKVATRIISQQKDKKFEFIKHQNAQ